MLLEMFRRFLLAKSQQLFSVRQLTNQHPCLHIHRYFIVSIGHNESMCSMRLPLWHTLFHDDVIKWKPFSRYWPFAQGIHRSPVNSPHKGQWRRALMFSLICAWINSWVNNREAGDLRHNRAHHDVTIMWTTDADTEYACTAVVAETHRNCARYAEIIDDFIS